MADARRISGLSILPVIAALLPVPAVSQQNPRFDIPAWHELEPLDPAGARIQRFAFTARGVSGLEFPIPGSQKMFCVLNQEHNLLLNYYPANDTWVFQVQLNATSQFAAGGIATCQRAAPDREVAK